MIGFILSKLNLLILVTAIFAIVSYFSFWLGQSIVSQEAQQIINRYARNAETVIYSPNQCNITSFTVPSYLNFFGNLDNGGRLFFLLDISKIENISGTENGKQLNSVIVSIADKKTRNIISAKSFGTIAKVRLFDWNPKDDTIFEVEEGKSILVNPQSAPTPTNSVFLIKDVFEGEQFLFVLPCSSKALSCATNLQKLGNKIACERNGITGCIPCEFPLDGNPSQCNMSQVTC